MLRDEDTGRAITFTCEDCVGREPQVAPQIHPNGETVTNLNISSLQDSDGQESRTFGEYDNRDQRKAINEEAQRAFNQGYKNLQDERVANEELILKSLNIDKKQIESTNQESGQETHTTEEESTQPEE
jgi:hypothetical protein